MDSELLISVEQIADSYGKEMRARARRILMSDSDAEDAVQETLLNLLSAPHMLGGIERIGAWLVTLVTRRSIDIIRRESMRRGKESAVEAEDLEAVPDPDALLDRDEAARMLTAALRRLPDTLREPFVQNALEGMTFEEMSRKTGIPMGTLMARKKKAQDRIRAEMRRKGFAL
jgi:RNA polymerase sigma-70 factor (ECF subfamily)